MNTIDSHRFVIYITEGPTRFYLRDWIVSDRDVNLTFATMRRYAMTFPSLKVASHYRLKMLEMGYHPHIE